MGPARHRASSRTPDRQPPMPGPVFHPRSIARRRIEALVASPVGRVSVNPPHLGGRRDPRVALTVRRVSVCRGCPPAARPAAGPHQDGSPADSRTGHQFGHQPGMGDRGTGTHSATGNAQEAGAPFTVRRYQPDSCPPDIPTARARHPRASESCARSLVPQRSRRPIAIPSADGGLQRGCRFDSNSGIPCSISCRQAVAMAAIAIVAPLPAHPTSVAANAGKYVERPSSRERVATVRIAAHQHHGSL